MDMNYTEAKIYIEKLRSEYCCKGDLIFRCAVQNVVEYGVVPLTINLAVEDWIYDIDRRHDEAEAAGKVLWIGRDFEKAMAECTFKLAKVGSMNLMMYIEREMWHQDHCNEISYEKAIKMICDLIVDIRERSYDNKGACEALYDIGIEEEDLIELGFNWLIKKEDD